MLVMLEPLVPSPLPRDLIDRIRMEYLEMPGLALTRLQARRLWNFDPLLCEAILAALVSERFLLQSTDGTFLTSFDTTKPDLLTLNEHRCSVAGVRSSKIELLRGAI